jgi:competence protein ComEC
MRAELEGRPLVLALLALALGLVSARPVQFPVALLLLVALLGVASRPPLRVGLALAWLTGAVLAPSPVTEWMLDRPLEVTLEGQVVGVPRLLGEVSVCDFEVGLHRLTLQFPTRADLSLGDRAQVRGRLLPLGEASRDVMLARRVVGRLRATRQEDVRIVDRGPALFRWGLAWRDAFVAFCGAATTPKIASAVDALCFNAGALLDEETRQNLRRTGTAHLVAASGLHVLIFAFALQGVLATLPFPRWVQLAILTVLLLLYAGATGFRPPVVRAIVMAQVAAAAYLLRREGDGLSALGAAGALYLLWKPESIADVGFQLSFVTVAGLTLFLRIPDPPQGVLPRAVHAATAVVRTSWVAILASSPLIAYHFGHVSLVALLANVLLAFVVAPVVLGALAAWAVAPALPEVACGLVRLIEPLVGWLFWTTDTLGGLPLAAVEVPAFGWPWLLVVYGAFLGVWRLCARRW